MTEEEQKLRALATKINIASSLIESNRISGGNMIFSTKWVMDNIIGGRNVSRKYKINKILNDEAGEI